MCKRYKTRFEIDANIKQYRFRFRSRLKHYRLRDQYSSIESRAFLDSKSGRLSKLEFLSFHPFASTKSSTKYSSNLQTRFSRTSSPFRITIVSSIIRLFAFKIAPLSWSCGSPFPSLDKLNRPGFGSVQGRSITWYSKALWRVWGLSPMVVPRCSRGKPGYPECCHPFQIRLATCNARQPPLAAPSTCENTRKT